MDILNYIKSNQQLSDLKKTTEIALERLLESIKKKEQSKLCTIFDGGVESSSEVYNSEITPQEKELFDLLIDNIEINKKTVENLIKSGAFDSL